MPSQKFDISILLNVLSQGDDKLEDLAKAILNLSRAGEIARKALSKDFFGADVTERTVQRLEKVIASVRRLSQVDIGGTKVFDELRIKVLELQAQAAKGVFLNVNTDIKELDVYIKRLEDVRKAAEKLDDKELFTSISAQIDGAKLLRYNIQQAAKVSLDKNISQFKVLLDEVNTRIKTTVKEAKVLASTGSSPTDLSVYINQLQEARKNLEFLSKEAQSLGISTRTIDTSIAKLNDEIKQLKTGKPAQIGTVQGLDALIQQFNQFEAKAKAGIPIDFIVPKAELDQLEKKLNSIRNEAAKNQDLQIFQDSTQLLAQLEAAKQELKRIEQIQLDKAIFPYKQELKEANIQLKELTKQGKNLIDTGADVATLKLLRDKIDATRNELIRLRDEAQKLGKSSVDIDLRIAEAEKALRLLDAIGNEQVQIKRNEIDLRVKNKLALDGAVQSLKELNRQLDEAIEKRDFRAINDLKRRTNEVRAQYEGLAPQIRNSGNVQAVNIFSGFTQGLDTAEKRLNSFQQQAGTGLTRLYNNISANFRNGFREAGGTNAALKATAGTFRLLGNAAFVAGGELRRFGFAFSAIGTIIQNFLPLIFTLIKSLGLASIPIVSLVASVTALSIELIALGGALAAVAKTGLEFNDAFARTRNNIAGIVGLFFDVTESGQAVGQGLEPTQAAMARLAATSQVVSKELRELTFEALTTEFTTEELFPAFNAVATSGSKLAPNLQVLTELTGGLARVSSVAGVSAANLGSSITQLISGTGRVTNPLQRFFNQVKDSQGIELTAKRIRALRNAGGDRLLNELLLVTEKFSVLGEEQAKTLSGSFSNIIDAFELFSGAATQKAYDTLRIGFERIKNLVTEQVQETRIDAEGVIQKVTVGPKGQEKPKIVSQFTKPVLELQKTLDNLFNKISQDFLGFFNKIIQYIVSVGKVLTDNYSTVVAIYESSKQIVATVAHILSDFLSIFGISKDTNTNLGTMSSILQGIAYITYGIRVNVIVIESAISGLLALIGLAFRLFLKIQQLSPGTDLIPGLRGNLEALIPEVDKFNSRLSESFTTVGSKLKAATADFDDYKKTLLDLSKPKYQKFKEIAETPEVPTALQGQSSVNFKDVFTPTKKVNRLLDEGATANEIVALGFAPEFVNKIISRRDNRFELKKNPFTGEANEDKKGLKRAKDRNIALDDEQKRFIEAQVSYAKAAEQNQYNLVRDRLARQQSLLQSQLDAGITAQSEATVKVLELKQRELNAEQLIKNNEIARIKDKQTDLDIAFKEEEARIRKEVKTANQLRGRLDQLELKRNTEKLKNKEDILRLEGEIAQIQERQLDLQLDAVNAQLASRKELIKTNQELKRSLNDLADSTSASTLAATQRNIVQEQAEQVRQLEVALNSIKPSDFANLGVFAGAGAFLQAKQLLTENLDLLKQQLEIRVQLARFDFAQLQFQTRQNELRLDEDNIQQNLATGKISEYETAVRTRVVQLQYVEALKLANEELEKSSNKTAQQQQLINENKLLIRKLSEEIPDSGITEVTRNIGDSFTTLFERMQEDIGDTKNAFRDLANSILGSFRRLIAQRISEALFEQLLTPKGKVGKFLENLGLSRQAKIDEEAVARTANTANEALQKTQQALGEPQKTAQQLLDEVNNEFQSKTLVFTNALKALAAKITNVSLAIPTFNAADAKRIADEALTTNILTQINAVGVENLVVNNLMLTELRNIVASLNTIGSVNDSGFSLSSIIPPEAKNGGLIGKLQYFAKGGLGKGADIIPAYLSNGEYVVSPEMVQRIGLPILNYINKYGSIPKFASGGAPTAFGNLFNFAVGGASLLNKPAAIVEKVLAPVRKKGGFRKIFGNILSFAAPFLNFIPGIGPFLALGAGAAGGALTGEGKLGSILGGVFGGLSNFGGFSKSSGILGSISRGVGSNTGKFGLSLFSGLLGNSGNALGQLGAGLFGSGKLNNFLGIFKNLGGSAFLKKIVGFLSLLKVGGSGKGSILPGFASGGSVDLNKLLGLFGVFSSISRLFGGSNQPEYTEEIIDDPDAARKNLFGSAYSKLVDSGFIPEFQYSAATLEKLRNQLNGIKNLVKTPKQSFLSKLFGVLPSLAGLFNFGGSGINKVGTASRGIDSVIDSIKLASGGYVKGKGSGTSDSILSLLRPDSFVLRASSVSAMEKNLLDSIGSQVFGFAEGGSVSQSLLQALPELVPNVTTGNQSVSIHNYTDFDAAFRAYLSSPQGTKAVLNSVNRSKNSVNGILRGRAK